MAQRPKARPRRTLGLLFVLLIALLGSVVAGNRLSDATFAPKLALDLEGGTQLILTPKTTDNSKVTQEDVDQAIEIIRQRVDASGVSEAEITSQGGQNIVVSLPGKPDKATLDLVRRSAQLRFRPVLLVGAPTTIDPAAAAAAQQPADGATPAPTETPTTPPTREEVEQAARTAADTNGDGQLSTEPTAAPTSNSDLAWLTEQTTYDYLTLDCTDPANRTGGITDDPAAPLVACSTDGSAKYVLGPTDLEGTRISSASSGMGTNNQGVSTGQWIVSLQMDREGTKQFAEVSQRLVGQQPPQNQFAIVLDGLVISAPVMQNAILDGRAQISGSFTRESSTALANQLNFGSLPLNFEVQSEDQISATLGSEQLARGVLAGILGAALVVLYMLWQYRGLGLVAVASLLIAAALTYGVIALLSWTIGYRLSLPGVVGMIVAIGVTADSFIVYFERIRDEVREGRILADAVDHGWSRARRTILASDAVNFLAAVVLYFLAVGGVRGFAFTLGLTTLIDLVVVVMFTHPLMQLLVRTKFFGQGHRLSGLDPVHLGATASTYRGRGRFGPSAAPARPARAGAEEKTLVGAGVGSSAGGAEARPGRAERRAAPVATEPIDDAPRMTIAERRAAERAEARRREAEAADQAGPAAAPPPGDPADPPPASERPIDSPSAGGER
ncbi:protein translocase subunit SecD [Georgenia sp. SYP-B2076]|uniref:protein translocase subunit SecD n=1 Tax=Georgenia sp. SYP-B2076 TaxID=2495881 RepID=UPI000F8E63AD|nr:protein translocase subunit SecD [Georgenia sp. SYP-B2076]